MAVKAGYIYKGDGQRVEAALSYRHQDGLDIVHEWVNLDSAGYSLPHQPTAVLLQGGDTLLTTKESLRLFQVTDSRGQLVNGKVHAHVLWQGAIPEVGFKPGWNAGVALRSGQPKWGTAPEPSPFAVLEFAKPPRGGAFRWILCADRECSGIARLVHI